MKVYQHNLVIDAFLRVLGVEPDARLLNMPKPRFSHLIVMVNERMPLAMAEGHTLWLAPGDRLRVLHASANFEHGLSVDVDGLGSLNDMDRILAVDKDYTIIVRKDHTPVARAYIAVLPAERQNESPLITGGTEAWKRDVPVPSSLEVLPGTGILAALEAAGKTAAPQADSPDSQARATARQSVPDSPPAIQTTPQARISAFLLEVNGKSIKIKPGEELSLPYGAVLRLVNLQSDGPLPQEVVMNLRGFVSKRNTLVNTGEDRGSLVNTVSDMLPAFSEGRKGEVYSLNAELGKNILASCALKIALPKLETVTVRLNGERKVLPLNSRTAITPGAKVELLEIKLRNGGRLNKPRLTLAGRPLPSTLPQTLRMHDIAINLAVFDGDTLAGKVTWLPKKP
jgi:hypothetical protein